MLSDPGVRANLAPSELQYVKNHLVLLNSHYQASFLGKLPAPLQRLDDTAGGTTMIETPDLDAAVFCRVVKDVEDTISFPGTDTEDFVLRKGDVLVVRYSAVMVYIKKGDVELI